MKVIGPFGEIVLAIVQIDAILQGRVIGVEIGVAATAHVQVIEPIVIGIKKDRVGVVAGFVGFKSGLGFAGKLGIFFFQK